MSVREDGVPYVSAAERERLRSLVLALMVIAGLALVVGGIVSPLV